VLQPPKISLGQTASTNNPRYAKINKGIFNVRDKLFTKTKVPISYWLVFYTGWNDDHYNETKDLAYELRKIGKGFGIDVHKPTFLEYNPNPRGRGRQKPKRKDISKELARVVKEKKIRFIMCFLDNKNKNLYSEIKKACL
jgi:hypothetical protein